MSTNEKINEMLWNLTRASRFYVFLFVILLAVLYGLIRFGYQQSLMPMWFDTMVQSNGIWKVLGLKEYEVQSLEYGEYWIEPTSQLVSTVEVSRTIESYVIDRTVSSVTLRKGISQSYLFDIDPERTTYYYIIDSGMRLCERCSIDDVNVTDLVRIQEVASVNPRSDATKVDRLNILIIESDSNE